MDEALGDVEDVGGDGTEPRLGEGEEEEGRGAPPGIRPGEHPFIQPLQGVPRTRGPAGGGRRRRGPFPATGRGKARIVMLFVLQDSAPQGTGAFYPIPRPLGMFG